MSKNILLISLLSTFLLTIGSVKIRCQTANNDSLTISLLNFKMEKLEEDIEKLNEKNRENEINIRNLIADTIELSNQIRSLMNDCESINELLSERDSLQKSVDYFNYELSFLRKTYQDDSSSFRIIAGINDSLSIEIVNIKTIVTDLTKQLDSISSLLTYEIEQKKVMEAELNLKTEALAFANDTINVYNMQIVNLKTEIQSSESVSQKMRNLIETLNKKAEICETQYKTIKSSTNLDNINNETISNLINDLELLNELFPDDNYSTPIKELNDLRVHIILIDSAQKALNQPFNNGKVVEIQRNLNQISNNSIAYNKAKEIRNLLSQYKLSLNLFEGLLKSIKYIDSNYPPPGNSTYDKKQFSEILEAAGVDRADIVVIPFLKRKLEELLKIKENNVHEDVSNILKQE